MKRNLITGTRYLNLDGMLSFENQVCWYIQNCGNHVLYRVTPWFEGTNLVATGVQIEARSVEDNGTGICFNVFCFNIQPGVAIDYLTGESFAELPNSKQPDSDVFRSHDTEIYIPSEGVTYILNTNTMRFHRNFWARGYYVDTVGRNKEAIKKYIQNQLQKDQLADQMSIKEYFDPFTGEEYPKRNSDKKNPFTDCKKK